jgi:hypothetical protein
MLLNLSGGAFITSFISVAATMIRIRLWWEVSYIIIVFGGALTSLLLSAYAWRYRTQTGAKAFAGFQLTIAGWCLTSGFFAANSTFETAAFWNNLGMTTVVCAPVWFFVFVLQYAGYGKYLSARRVMALFIIPVGTQALLWTNDWHHL